MTTGVVTTEHSGTSPSDTPAEASRLARWRRRLPDPVTGAVVISLLIFVLGGLGLQLSGVRILADTSSLTISSVYRDGGMPVSSEGTLGVNDTIDAAAPNEVLFGNELRSGHFAGWNPYAFGGAPLAATPNYGLMSPLALPFWVLPGWLALAWVKLLEVVVAVGGTYLFLRRLKLSRAAATLGGLAYASSAFLIVWTGWPQTRTAALIPALFWALDRLAERVQWRNVGLVALAVASLLLSGFPSITGYALFTAAAYLTVRLLTRRPLHWPAVLARGGAAAGGVVAGVLLVAWQLVPWLSFMTTALIRGREQAPGAHLSIEDLLTSISPYALGGVSTRAQPTFFGSGTLVETESYVGAAVLVLALVGIALARRGRDVLPRGVWWFLVGSTAVWGVVVYHGGLLLGLLQQTGYLFTDNFVGRARSVLGLLVACLAAVGFELLLRGRTVPAMPTQRRPDGPGDHAARRPWPWARIYGTAVWVAVAGFGVYLYVMGRQLAANPFPVTKRTPDVEALNLSYLNQQLAIGLVLVLITAAACAWLWFRPTIRRPRLRTVTLVLIPLIVAGQGVAFAFSYYPHSRIDNFYPTNEVHDYLASTLDHERFFGATGALYGSVETIHGLRQFHGHGFMEREYGDLVAALPGREFYNPPTPASIIQADPAGGAAARSPILDRASVTEYVAPPEMPPFGIVHPAAAATGNLTLAVGTPLTVPVTVTGPLRGIGITPVGQLRQTLRTQIQVTLRDATTGAVVAQAARVDRSIRSGEAFVVPLAADALPAGTRLTATFELSEFTLVGADARDFTVKPMTVAAIDGQPVLTVVTPPVADDGLRLVFDGQSVIYQRTNALPRARWASSTVVEPDAAARVRLLASGTLPDDQVVLDSPGPATAGQPATVDWVDDGTDTMVLHVSAQGAGYLVLADPIQHGWTATVDGASTAIVPADHAFAAVPVPAGEHQIRFAYRPVTLLVGGVSGLTALGLLIPVILEYRRGRRRPAAVPTLAPAGEPVLA